MVSRLTPIPKATSPETRRVMQGNRGKDTRRRFDSARRAAEYVRDGISTNQAESFFAQFKRSLDGTHHNVSKEHLQRYASEFEFRWNTSKMSDSQRVQFLVDGAIGKRLTYKPITAR